MSRTQKAPSLFWWTKWEISLNSWFLFQSFHKLSGFVWDFFLVGCLSLWLSLFFLALISVDQIFVLSNSRGIPGQEQHSDLMFGSTGFAFSIIRLCCSACLFHFLLLLSFILRVQHIRETRRRWVFYRVSLLDWFFKELQKSSKCLALVLPHGSQPKDKCLFSWWKIISKPVCMEWLQALNCISWLSWGLTLSRHFFRLLWNVLKL